MLPRALFGLAFLFSLSAEPPTALLNHAKGTLTIHSEIVLPPNSHDLDIDARQLTIILSPDFRGRAAVVIPGGKNIHIFGLTIDGNREHIQHPAQGLPPNTAFAGFTRDNGILAWNVDGIRIDSVKMRNIAGHAILVNNSNNVHILAVKVSDSGSRNANKRNNTTGGILLEEGTRDFEIANCEMVNILGNGIWTHAYDYSPRNTNGRITGNRIVGIGRDAIQVGHATHVLVEKNTGARVGYPVDAVDVEAQAWPCAIDTSGDVDATQYRSNSFEEVNGKCIDLDGFHDGEVRDNACINHQGRDDYPTGQMGIVMNNTYPKMQTRNILIWGNRLEGVLYTGLLVIGSGHRISHNHFSQLNLAHCNEAPARFGCTYLAGEPDFLRSGIYLRNGASRPAETRDNVIEFNEMDGFGIGIKCVVFGPGVAVNQNRVGHNDCQDDQPVNARLWANPLLPGQAAPMTLPMALTNFLTGGSSNLSNTSNSPSRHEE
jgi:hypothetical protein